ncbi:Dipeptidyl aminopeptidase/acylaminoacyl peptidase [Quadrisphaera granulorum]|uniref:Dipeptidyl aminopeptidase/acylaminoacyl peptidase n=1 Tax=Quadrisphaera granulorum TaxID=317664 RepID=A0A316AEF5_9ACTN|nr:S9 family peptidase [Quadrisphaera granulorum]PWJ55360.1 dipeptidyl aminopeptidase/acylaminoacyl peptidase [Quadrisphaera granulorum]SZE95424.1 Dipeptidyl aminopeptidase/acylaminoacyl peptidase [Quadrisphaera granulorum]
MLPSDLPLLAGCSGPSLTPDGRTAVVSITAPDLHTDEEVGDLWRVPTDGSAPPRRLTRGHRDTAAAVSPDGRWVAFLRASPGAAPQLHLVETDGGEPIALTTAEQLPLGAGAPRWSPGGDQLAFCARVPEPGRYGTANGPAHLRGPDAEPPRLITTPAHRIDGVGFTLDRRLHAFVLDVDRTAVDAGQRISAPERPAPRQVTDGDADDTQVVWTTDGLALLVVSTRHEGAGHDQRRGAYRVEATAHREDKLVPVVTGDLAVSRVAADPDGNRLWLLATALDERGLGAVAQPESLYTAVLDLDDLGTTTAAAVARLTPPDVDLGDPAGFLEVDAAGALVAERTRGSLRLLRVRPDGSWQTLLDGPLQVTGVASTPDGTAAVAVVADQSSRGELVRVGPAAVTDGQDGEPLRLTDAGGPLRATGRLRPLLEVEHPSRDGYPVHGWVVLPDEAHFGAGPHPVLLLVHGGPHAQYGWALFDEAQVAAGAGYAVVMGNPRGSAGYGLAHGEAVLGALGTVDADDVEALLDGVLADASLPLDAERVGVMGGSYGGYMAALLTTRTHRFAAAVVERGYLDATSFVGSADIGWYFPDQLHGSDAAMREQSPLTHVASVRTPTLVIHSEQDWRCPVEQGQRWWTALRRQGVETALLLFPGEGHELTRSGRPSHRTARFEHLARWWERHLPV